MLTGLSLTVAMSTGLILSAAAVLACAQLAPFARIGQWSAPALRDNAGFPTVIGILALLVILPCLIAASIRATRSLHALIRASRTVRLLQPDANDLVLVQDETPIAYSVAGWRGRIVVSTAMLCALSAPERRVLLAHEAAHLRHRHHLYIHLAQLAAAANPLLRSTAAAIARSVERSADEDAAAEVGDRQLAARALARAALAGAGHARAQHTLAAADADVVERVRLLLAPAAAQKRVPVVLIVLAGLLLWATSAAITLWANHVVQIAESVYLHR
jgi:Zn-dependent protease with chaperone function